MEDIFLILKAIEKGFWYIKEKQSIFINNKLFDKRIVLFSNLKFYNNEKKLGNILPIIFEKENDYKMFFSEYAIYPEIINNNTHISMLIMLGKNVKRQWPETIKDGFDFSKEIVYNSIEYSQLLNSMYILIVKNLKENFNTILNITGSSGTGKSVFIKKLMMKLTNNIFNFNILKHYNVENIENINNFKYFFSVHELYYDNKICDINRINNGESILFNDLSKHIKINKNVILNSDNKTLSNINYLLKNNLYNTFPRIKIRKTLENEKSSRSLLIYVLYVFFNNKIQTIILIDNIGFEYLPKETNMKHFNSLDRKINSDINNIELIFPELDEEIKKQIIEGYFGYTKSIRNFFDIRNHDIEEYPIVEGETRTINILTLPIGDEFDGEIKKRDFLMYKKFFWIKNKKDNLFLFNLD